MKRLGKRDILRELRLKKESSLFVVQFFAGQLHKFPIQFQAEHTYLKKIVFLISPVFKVQFEQLLSSSKGITFYLDSLDCMFKCQIESFDNITGDIITSLPLSFVFEERRAKSRVVVSDSMQMLYNEDSGQVINKKVFDISSGGFSLVFSASEQFRLKQDQLLKHVYLSYDGKFQYFDSRVLAILKLRPFDLESLPYALRRVSFGFDSIDEEQKLFLEYVSQGESSLQNKKTS